MQRLPFLLMALFFFSFLVEAATLPEKPAREWQPADRYSGSTPIDLTHGMNFNRGTFGLPNHNVEAFAQAKSMLPYLSAIPYPYERKNDFLNGYSKWLRFLRHARANWERALKDDPGEYDKLAPAIDLMKESIAKTEDTFKRLRRGKKTSWAQLEAEGRLQLLAALKAYSAVRN